VTNVEERSLRHNSETAAAAGGDVGSFGAFGERSHVFISMSVPACAR
jgi:hypothetical protein